MHGRPRVKGLPDPERVKAAAQKAVLLGRLNTAVLEARIAGAVGPEVLRTSSKLLELNPEMYTAWNHRREILGPLLQAGGVEAMEAAAGELDLTQRALSRNPKSYSTWHHRRWVVGHRLSSLEGELSLVELLLDADDRNFHGWLYRSHVAHLMGMPLERELDYTTLKIQRNFSNYSAWHYRTRLLPLVHAPAGARGDADLVPLAVLEAEYELVSQAFFTEPEDQSGWIYHRWLLGCSRARWAVAAGTEREGAERAELVSTLHGQLELVGQLQDAEPDCVWGRKARAHLLGMLGEVDDSVEGGGARTPSQEALQALHELQAADPFREAYYRHVSGLVSEGCVVELGA